jgi:hypothetical protein
LFEAVNTILNTFASVSLTELDSVKLLNRVDRKYMMHIDQLPMVLADIKADQFVLEIDNSRVFNYKTNYFDTPDFQFYKDHHNGFINRVKVRSREYIESHLCFYEIKRKLFGTRTDKQRKRVDNILEELNTENYNMVQYKRLLNKPLEKKLSNSFSRITLTNKQFTERITIDLNIAFTNDKDVVSIPHIVIVEVKQGKTDIFSNTIQVLKKHRIQPASFSKYTIGVAMLEKEIKHNRFKPQLLKINKLLHAKYGEINK